MSFAMGLSLQIKMALTNRVALVTGGASGIGRAVCQLFAKEGASVVVADAAGPTEINDVARTLTRNTSTEHMSVSVDVRSRDQIMDAVKAVRDTLHSTPTVVVNAAGITREALLMKMTEDQFDEVIDVNLKGTFLVTQAVSKALVKDKLAGSIVNISSIVAKTGNIGQANYSASKGGVISMTKTCARELSGFGIRCNAVLPGFISTPMTDKVPDKIKGQVLGLIPMARFGNPEEVAHACLFLASDSSSYITGASIEVAGGLSM